MLFLDRYKYTPSTDLIGKGGFARVYKATDTLLDREVAIKVFNATDAGQYTVVEEIKKAIRLQHPNLLRYYDVAIVENNNALGENEIIQIGVMELANAGDLKQFARKNPQSPALFKLLQQVLSGLEYLHQKGIIHRDLKPQNILLVEEDGEITAKISDFGISKNLDSGTNSASMAIGTIEYMAPEQFSPTKYGINGKIGTNVDLWSFGIMVHELLTNEPLFGQRNGNTTAEQIMNAILSQTVPPDVENLPHPYKKVVKKCLVSDAKERIQKANELLKLLDEVDEGSAPQVDSGSTQIYTLPKEEAIPDGATMVVPMPKAEKPEEKKAPVVEEKKAAPVAEPKAEAPRPVTPVAVPTPAPTSAEAQPQAQKKKSNKALIIAACAIPFVAACLWFGFRKPAEGAATEESTQQDVAAASLQSIETSYTNNDYAAVLLELARSKDQLGEKEYAKYFGLATLAKGDTINAAPFLEKSAAFGDAESAYEIGNIYSTGVGSIKKDEKKADTFFTNSANNGNAKAMVTLANQNLKPGSYPTAVKYYEKAAEQNNSVALFGLGICYSNGFHVSKDITKAKGYFQKAIANGDNQEVIAAASAQLSSLKN